MKKTELKIFLGSSNEGKLREIRGIFADFAITCDAEAFKKLRVKEDGNAFEENALKKAKAFFESLPSHACDAVAMSDDSGLCVDALGGEPGVKSARYAALDAEGFENADDDDNVRHLIHKLTLKGLTGSRARFVSVIALYGMIEGKIIREIFRGELAGRVINEKRGKNGFGYDGIFIPEGREKTLGELEFEEKNAISHRKIALQKAREFLDALALS